MPDLPDADTGKWLIFEGGVRGGGRRGMRRGADSSARGRSDLGAGVAVDDGADGDAGTPGLRVGRKEVGLVNLKFNNQSEMDTEKFPLERWRNNRRQTQFSAKCFGVSLIHRNLSANQHCQKIVFRFKIYQQEY